MTGDGKTKSRRFAFKDYVALAVSLLVAFSVWIVHNLSLPYSGIAQCSVVAVCKIDGHADKSTNSERLAAMCNMSGFDFLGAAVHTETVTFTVNQDDMHPKGGDEFYMTADDLTQYFHDIFGNESKLEYFITDTLFFTFPSVECKKVPIHAVVSMDFKEQYMPVGELKLSHDSVLVYGNESRLIMVDRVETDPVYLYSLCDDVYGEVQLKQIKDVRLSLDKVTYSLSVTRFVEQRVKIPVRIEGAPEDVQISVYPASATLIVKSVFPDVTDFSSTYVSVGYDEFAGSLSGKCCGVAKNLPVGVMEFSLQPDFFDCIIQGQ